MVVGANILVTTQRLAVTGSASAIPGIKASMSSPLVQEPARVQDIPAQVYGWVSPELAQKLRYLFCFDSGTDIMASDRIITITDMDGLPWPGDGPAATGNPTNEAWLVRVARELPGPTLPERWAAIDRPELGGGLP